MKRSYVTKATVVCIALFMFLNGMGRNSVNRSERTNPGIQWPGETKDPYRIYRDWWLVIETSNHIEISARVVQCEPTGPSQVQLLFFNENPTAKNLSFSVKIVNDADGKSFTLKKTVQAALAAMYIPDCSNGDAKLESLKIALPADYNPEKLTVSISL